VNIPCDNFSALATPGVWEEPDFRYTKEFIWIFDTEKSHWYHYNMGNNQDDLEISNEEKVDISSLFAKHDNNNKELLNEGTKEKHKSRKNQLVIKIKMKQILEKEKDKRNKDGENFYKVNEQETTKLKINELNPVGFKYNIINTDSKKDENFNKNENKSNKDKEEDDEEEGEDIENINKNIFN